MHRPRLNENQARRVGTHLSLLAEDAAALALSPELSRAEEPYRAIKHHLEDLEKATESMRIALHLPPSSEPGLKQRLLGFAGVWATRVEDLRPERLTGYGAVAPGLDERMAPYLDEFRRLLHALAELVVRLPESSP